MDVVLKQILQETYFILEKRNDVKILINGKSCSGKTKLANKLLNLFSKSEKYKPFILNGLLFNNFFNLTMFNNFKIIKVPIENSKIIIDYTNGYANIHPFPETDAYKNIFKEHKYIEKFKRFSFDKNLMIIDDCERINLEVFDIFDKAMRIIFNSNKQFGGIALVLIGNSKVNTPFENIFSSALYSNNKNIYKQFKVFNINNIKTRFSIMNPNLEYVNLHYFTIREKIKNRVGLLSEEDKKFFRSRDVEINRKDLINEIYFSDDYNEIKEYNNNMIKKFQNKKFILKPTKLFNENEVSKDKLNYFYKLYEKILEPITLCEEMKVFFTSGISELEIKKGDMGIIKKINLRNVLNSEGIIDMNKGLRNVIVRINNKDKEIELKKVLNIETGLSFKCLPINLAYCIHFRYLTYLDKANLILTKDTNINLVESCINKITDIGFKNTYLLNYPKLFEPTYSDFIKNGIKL